MLLQKHFRNVVMLLCCCVVAWSIHTEKVDFCILLLLTLFLKRLTFPIFVDFCCSKIWCIVRFALPLHRYHVILYSFMDTCIRFVCFIENCSVRENGCKCVFSQFYKKVYGLFALHVNVGRIFFMNILVVWLLIRTFVAL